MNTTTWVEQTMEEFGQSLGFDDLQFDERGLVQLEITGRGVLRLELQDDSVLIYLTRAIVDPDSAILRRALQLSYHGESGKSWLQAALLGDDEIAFAIEIPLREFHSATLENAITELTDLHDALVTEATT